MAISPDEESKMSILMIEHLDNAVKAVKDENKALRSELQAAKADMETMAGQIQTVLTMQQGAQCTRLMALHIIDSIVCEFTGKDSAVRYNPERDMAAVVLMAEHGLGGELK
jgi:hypothetical protein